RHGGGCRSTACRVWPASTLTSVRARRRASKSRFAATSVACCRALRRSPPRCTPNSTGTQKQRPQRAPRTSRLSRYRASDDATVLRGLGGAGFPTGQKWRLVQSEARTPKYVVCNADESEPGTFKDRVLLAEAPHLVLEGIALAGRTVGAERGIVYLRHEYGPE